MMVCYMQDLRVVLYPRLGPNSLYCSFAPKHNQTLTTALSQTQNIKSETLRLFIHEVLLNQLHMKPTNATCLLKMCNTVAAEAVEDDAGECIHISSIRNQMRVPLSF